MQGRPIAFKYSAGGAARSMPAYDDGSTPTLVTEKPPAIAVRTAQTTANGCGVSDELAHTIDTTGPEAVVYADGGAMTQEGAALPTESESGYVVRRLTPLECERLQGMTDNHTKVPYRGKPAEECPDGPRYKAIGNSMAVPVMRWIGERVQEVDALLFSEGDADGRGD